MREKRFSYMTRVLEPGDILYLRLSGIGTPRLSRDTAPAIADQLQRGGFRGLVIDFRPVRFVHNETQFDHLSGLTAHLFPDRLVTAFVYGPAQKPHAIMMIRALQAGGMLAGAFCSHRDAVHWVRDTLTFRDVSAPVLARTA